MNTEASVAYLDKLEMRVMDADVDELKEYVKELIGIVKQQQETIARMERDIQHFWTYAEGVR